jgi:hypothetical protein
MNSNQANEGGEADDAQSDERSLGVASSGFFGNPTRRSKPISPARSAKSETFHSVNSRCVIKRQGKGKATTQVLLSKNGAHGSRKFQYEHGIMGQDMGRIEVPLGLNNLEEDENHLMGKNMGRSEAPLSQNNLDEAEHYSLGQEAACEIANMEITPMANAEPHPSDGRADPSTPKLNTKKWKRMARHLNQSSVSPQVSRKAKRGRAEIDVTQTTGMIGSEKRQKVVDAT